MATIFISYVTEDRVSMESVLNWKRQDKKLNIVFNTDKLLIDKFGEKNQLTEAEITKELKGLISKSNALLILVGADSHNKPWIEWEYNYAQNNKLKVGLMRVPNSTGAVPPLVPEMEIHKLSLKALWKLIKDWGWTVPN